MKDDLVSVEKAYRVRRCKEVMEKAEVDALLLTTRENIYYTTGFNAEQLERFFGSIISKDSKSVLIVPLLEYSRAKTASWTDVQKYTEFPSPEVLELTTKVIEEAGLDNARIGIEGGKIGLGISYYDHLSKRLSKASFVDLSEELAKLRICKSDQEISLMRKSAVIIERGLQVAHDSIRPGVSEASVAGEIIREIVVSGGELTPDLMVQSGPRGADGHAVTSQKKMEKGDLVVIDIAITCEGYYADLTRTFVIGHPDERQRLAAKAVEGALQAAKQVVKPNVPISLVNEAARSVIVGYMGSNYTYRRTGHGLGLLVHEPPYVAPKDNTVLMKGMTFTLEPGIYVGGWGGIRIEDNVAVTDAGVQVLNSMEPILMEV